LNETGANVKQVKILIADDHSQLRRGIRDLLENEYGYEVVDEAGNGLEAVSKAGKIRPDLLITDMKMPGLDGAEVTKKVKLVSPETRVIILSMHNNKVYIEKALEAGASAYVLKKYADENLQDAILAVMQGRRYLSPGLENGRHL